MIKHFLNFIFIASLIIAGLMLGNTLLGERAIKIYVVTSGSMEPAIKTGSIVAVVPQTDYHQNDIITYRSGAKITTTHRIVFKTFPKGIYSPPVYLTAGDANTTFDTHKPTPEDVVGRVFLTVPYVGFLAGYSKTPQGFILLVIVPATIIIYEELKSLTKFPKNWLEKFSPKPAVALPIVGALFVIGSLTGAYFYDRATSTQNILGVATIYPSPTPTPIPTNP